MKSFLGGIMPSWDQTKTQSKKGFDKTFAWADKLGAPVNRFSNKIGSEAFWPTTLDKESDKAARILKSFCKDGFYAEEDRLTAADTPAGKQRVLKKIPQKVIQEAVGLAIFTTMRTGLWVSGAGGSGILIARKEDGTWSPPSGILLHTAGLGFMIGIDIYDCVVVINNRKALESFKHPRATLGGEISVAAGPVGIGGVLENDGKWKQANRPVFTYLKSRGFYAGIQVDGTIIIERTDENERFYGQGKVRVSDILAGKIHHPPYELKMLMETLKAAEGSGEMSARLVQDLDEVPAPADIEIDIQPPTTTPPGREMFGIPEEDDDDPYGVRALEAAGFVIREAGSHIRPSSTQFEFNPCPSSPMYKLFHNRPKSLQTGRNSFTSIRTGASVDRRIGTDGTSESQQDSHESRSTLATSETKSLEDGEWPPSAKTDTSSYHESDHHDLDRSSAFSSPLEPDESTTDEEFLSDDEEPQIFETAAAQVMTPDVNLTKGKVISIVNVKRSPPPLPPRSMARISAEENAGFEDVPLHGHSRQPSREVAMPSPRRVFGFGPSHSRQASHEDAGPSPKNASFSPGSSKQAAQEEAGPSPKQVSFGMTESFGAGSPSRSRRPSREKSGPDHKKKVSFGSIEPQGGPSRPIPTPIVVDGMKSLQQEYEILKETQQAMAQFEPAFFSTILMDDTERNPVDVAKMLEQLKRLNSKFEAAAPEWDTEQLQEELKKLSPKLEKLPHWTQGQLREELDKVTSELEGGDMESLHESKTSSNSTAKPGKSSFDTSRPIGEERRSQPQLEVVGEDQGETSEPTTPTREKGKGRVIDPLRVPLRVPEKEPGEGLLEELGHQLDFIQKDNVLTQTARRRRQLEAEIKIIKGQMEVNAENSRLALEEVNRVEEAEAEETADKIAAKLRLQNRLNASEEEKKRKQTQARLEVERLKASAAESEARRVQAKQDLEREAEERKAKRKSKAPKVPGAFE